MYLPVDDGGWVYVALCYVLLDIPWKYRADRLEIGRS